MLRIITASIARWAAWRLGGLVCGCSLGLLVALPAQAQPAAPRNVIVVLVDDLGWADLSCQGSELYRTPHIDALAARGMRLTNGYAACAVCSPTRAAYMTGRYPARLGITDWIRATQNRGGVQKTLEDRPSAYVANSQKPLRCPQNPFWMDHAEVTLAEQLSAAGYVTAHIGKWHLGDELWEPRTQGFAFNVAGADHGQPPSYFDPYERTDRQSRVWRLRHIESRRPGEYLTDREADEAVQFIRQHQDQNFFLSLCHYAVHTPIQAKPELAATYEDAAQQNAHQQNAKYAAMVHSVDDAMGRVLQTLDELDL
ncbi:MAG: sulfatase-like hydrolase/transferase, partial [Planctomycetota bacterium]